MEFLLRAPRSITNRCAKSPVVAFGRRRLLNVVLDAKELSIDVAMTRQYSSESSSESSPIASSNTMVDFVRANNGAKLNEDCDAPPSNFCSSKGVFSSSLLSIGGGFE